MKLVFIGYVTGPFGIKGEVKIVSETNHKNEIFKIGNILYIEDVSYKIVSIKKNNKHEIIGFENIDTIEKTNLILRKPVYVNLKEVNVNSYLIGQIPDMDVYEKEVFLGKVGEVLYNKKCTYIKVSRYIIPLIDNFVEKIDTDNNVIRVKNIGELDED